MVNLRRIAWALLLVAALRASAAADATGPATTQAAAADPPATTRAANADQLRQLVESVAAEMEWDDGGWTHDRPPQWGPNPEKAVALYRRLRVAKETRPGVVTMEEQALAPGPWAPDDIRPLLRHADPKVRTLAIVLLYQLNRADVLPDIAELVTDTGKSFPRTSLSAVGGFRFEDIFVGSVACSALNAWTDSTPELRPFSNFKGPTTNMREDRLQKRLADMRAAIKKFAATRHPTQNTAAFKVALRRATTGSFPIPADRRDRIEALMMVVADLPMPRRFFVARELDFQRHAGPRWSPDWLIKTAMELPRDIRLRAIWGEQRAIDDPDISDFGYEFFQEHAARLFTRADADAFLVIKHKTKESWETRPSAMPGMLLAAARIRPDRADEILGNGLDSLVNRSVGARMRLQLAVELALLGSDAGVGRTLDVFFEDMRELPDNRDRFLAGVMRSDPIRGRVIVERIIRDKRLETLDRKSTIALLTYVRGYLGRPLVAEEELRDARGVNEAQRDRKVDALPRWHAALRETVDEWSK